MYFHPEGWGAEELDDEDADWGDDWNAPAKPIIPVKKSVTKQVSKTSARKTSNTGLNSGFYDSNSGWGAEDDWDTDNWNSSSKSGATSAAAKKKAEREAKLAARKAENEK